MRIKSIHIRHFKSIETSSLAGCGGLNVLIGRNNAGKSNLLSAIEYVLRHLKRGLLATIVGSRWAQERFTDRDTAYPYRIAMEFDLPGEVNEQLRQRLSKEAPHLDRSIEQIKANSSITFVLAGAFGLADSCQFVEQIVVGSPSGDDYEIKIEGIRLLSVPISVGRELAHLQQQVGSLAADLKHLQSLQTEKRWLEFAVERKERFRALSLPEAFQSLSRDLAHAVEVGLQSASSVEGLITLLSQMAVDVKDNIETLKKKETQDSMAAFAGPAKFVPAYAFWLMEQYGAMSVLHLQETKQPIGREEADTLLEMKLQRGGMERLQTLQETIRALLGVDVDAFQAGGRTVERTAEMDVDNFLVEANGAGIRESLRLILDLELKQPNLLLVEEPEVHLHPGLARVMATYLRDKSYTVQMFVTTHSTEFVDSVSFQNAYLVARDVGNKTVCQAISSQDGPLLLPVELGLRLSTVFMFDRLIFVEGPSDEAVFRALAKNLGLDLTQSNVGFVHMCGVRNFAHFAAQGTLDLLSRRRIKMWFVTDRDERDDEDVNKMLTRLGDRADLRVLDRRELENYLLDGSAVKAFIDDKRAAAGLPATTDDAEAIARVIEEEAASLKDEVVRLRLTNRLLSPVFLNVRNSRGSIEERLKEGVNLLATRLDNLEAEKTAVKEEVEKLWDSRALNLAPGTLVLEQLAKRYGIAFSKANGDSERLAMHTRSVPYELSGLLREVLTQDMPSGKKAAWS